MPVIEVEPLQIRVDESTRVSAIATSAPDAHAVFVLAHGAGAGMTHPFMEKLATRLAERRIATLRYQFPYMEAQKKRPDRPERAHTAVRAAVDAASARCGTLPLFAGGKSFGARMTSQAQAIEPLPGVQGLVFFGFPLHPAGEPSTTRAAHLSKVDIPMLFFHGARDKLAEPSQFQPVVHALGFMAMVAEFADADHSFHVPARSSLRDDDVLDQMADCFAVWTQAWAL